MPAALYGNTEYGEFTPGGDDDAAHEDHVRAVGFIDGGDSVVGALDYSGGAV